MRLPGLGVQGCPQVGFQGQAAACPSGLGGLIHPNPAAVRFGGVHGLICLPQPQVSRAAPRTGYPHTGRDGQHLTVNLEAIGQGLAQALAQPVSRRIREAVSQNRKFVAAQTGQQRLCVG